MRFIYLIPTLLFVCSLLEQATAPKLIPGNTQPCRIKKLVVRITRILFSVYGDTTEPPVTEVTCVYYDPQSKRAKVLGKTPSNSNGRSLYPVWNEEDGTLESDDNPGLMSDLALEFHIHTHSKMRFLTPLISTVTMLKVPIIGIHGFEVRSEFHTIPAHHWADAPIIPKGTTETCTVNRLSNTFPFPNCVYGWVYFIVKYEKEDPDCDDSSPGHGFLGRFGDLGGVPLPF